MKQIKLKLRKIKSFFIHLIIGGRYFTENEVKDVLSKMQYDMAQNIIKSSEFQKTIIPLDYWIENNGKYNTNLYNKS